jgi:hypothetical protein
MDREFQVKFRNLWRGTLAPSQRPMRMLGTLAIDLLEEAGDAALQVRVMGIERRSRPGFALRWGI